jgi:hypothetical protein
MTAGTADRRGREPEEARQPTVPAAPTNRTADYADEAALKVPAPRGQHRFVGRAPVRPPTEDDAVALDGSAGKGSAADGPAANRSAADSTAAGNSPAERRWEIAIAVAIGVITMSSALVTYLALGQESKAAAADQRAVAETVLLQAQYTDATARTQANGGLAARYRRMTAEAEAYRDLDPPRARLAAAIANGFLRQSGIADYVGDGTASARFDYDTYRQVAIASHAGEGLSAGQADRTAAQADRHRSNSRSLTLSAVAMLAVVLLLTVARQVRRRRRAVLILMSAAGYLATVTVPAVLLA